ncbi:hypothetical protein BH11MYX2_BH11MYX2_11110 [soil metagenome]
MHLVCLGRIAQWTGNAIVVISACSTCLESSRVALWDPSNLLDAGTMLPACQKERAHFEPPPIMPVPPVPPLCIPFPWSVPHELQALSDSANASQHVIQPRSFIILSTHLHARCQAQQLRAVGALSSLPRRPRRRTAALRFEVHGARVADLTETELKLIAAAVGFKRLRKASRCSLQPPTRRRSGCRVASSAKRCDKLEVDIAHDLDHRSRKIAWQCAHVASRSPNTAARASSDVALTARRA